MEAFTLILYGFPGSGKGTQGKLIKEKFNVNYLASGDVVREIMQSNDELGKLVKDRYNKGIPQPDDVIVEIFKKKMELVLIDSKNKKFVIDGFPKSINQAIELDNLSKKLFLKSPFFIYLEVPENVVIDRISNRLFCTNCGISYLPTQDEYKKEICSRCGDKLSKRIDDEPETVKVRLQKEKIIISNLLKYYQKKERLITINGNQSIDYVHKDIVNKLKINGMINDEY